MSKIQKEEIQNHIVIPDTNILWFDDKTKIINPNLKILDNHSSSYL